jgi:hypothetical protein
MTWYIQGFVLRGSGVLEGVEYTIATTLVHPYMLNMLGVKS